MQSTPRLHASVTIPNKKGLAKGVRKIIETKRTPRPASAHIQRSFTEKLDPYMLSGVGQNSENVRIFSVDEKRIRTIRVQPYFPRTVKVYKYGCETRF